MATQIVIDPNQNLDYNLAVNGATPSSQIIGELDRMTLRSGYTYPTSSQYGGMGPLLKALIVCAAASAAAYGTALGGAYLVFGTQLCAPQSLALAASAYGAPALCAAKAKALTDAVAAITLFFKTVGVPLIGYLILTPEQEQEIVTLIKRFFPAFQKGGSMRRRSSKKQQGSSMRRRSGRKSSSRKQYK
jgi:hypothetical protein